MAACERREQWSSLPLHTSPPSDLTLLTLDPEVHPSGLTLQALRSLLPIHGPVSPSGLENKRATLSLCLSWKCSSLLCSTLCDPMDCSPPGSSVQGSVQARIPGKWVASPISRTASQPRGQTRVSSTAGRCFTVWASRGAQGTQRWVNRPASRGQSGRQGGCRLRHQLHGACIVDVVLPPWGWNGRLTRAAPASGSVLTSFLGSLEVSAAYRPPGNFRVGGVGTLLRPGFLLPTKLGETGRCAEQALAPTPGTLGSLMTFALLSGFV